MRPIGFGLAAFGFLGAAAVAVEEVHWWRHSPVARPICILAIATGLLALSLMLAWWRMSMEDIAKGD